MNFTFSSMLPCTYFIHIFVREDNLLLQTIRSLWADVSKSSQETETILTTFTDKM